MPFFREIVAARGRGLVCTVVDPARVGFSLIICMSAEDKARAIEDIPRSSLTRQTLKFSDPVSKFSDFVNVWIVPYCGIIDFVDAEAGLMMPTDENQSERALNAPSLAVYTVSTVASCHTVVCMLEPKMVGGSESE
jgi:hypothetical protein